MLLSNGIYFTKQWLHLSCQLFDELSGGWGWDGVLRDWSVWEEMLGCDGIELQKIDEGIDSHLSWSVFGWKVCIQFAVCKFILYINLGEEMFSCSQNATKQSTCILLCSVNKICWLISTCLGVILGSVTNTAVDVCCIISIGTLVRMLINKARGGRCKSTT